MQWLNLLFDQLKIKDTVSFLKVINLFDLASQRGWDPKKCAYDLLKMQLYINHLLWVTILWMDLNNWHQNFNDIKKIGFLFLKIQPGQD